MIEGLKPYAEYKESGVPWMGHVPHKWRVERTKWVFRCAKELNVSRRNTNVLSLTLRGVVNNNPDSPEGMVPKDYATYQLFRKHDLVFKLIDLENIRTSRVGLVHEDGIMSSAYVRLIPSKDANVRFFYFQFFDLYTRAVFNALGAGVRSTLGPTDLGELRIAIPPPDEQAAIVRFLDHANRKMEGFIRAKRKLIGLLNEQKQAIIHRAVTGKDEVKRMKDENGNSSFPKKPSGIPWIGDIPAHWEVSQLRRVCRRIKTGGTPKGADASFFESGGFNWHTPSDFRDAIELADASRQLSSLGVKEVTVFPSNTILMIGIGATIGKVSISRKPCSCNQQINAILPNTRLVRLEFLAFYLRTLRSFIVDCGKFTTMPIINQDETKRLPVLIPPISEQVEIAKHIEKASKPFTTAIARTEREIALMQEYRTRLTADLVTGKLDVRAAAAQLPAPPTAAAADPDEPLEEPEAEESE